MTKSEMAAEIFSNRFNCAQAVLAAYSDECNIDFNTALRVSGSFGGGVGRTGNLCGAVSGALMVIGCRYGQTESDEVGKKEKNYEMVREFMEKFTSKCGSCDCTGILGHDISTSAGMKAAKEKGLFDTVCVNAVKTSAEIVGTMI